MLIVLACRRTVKKKKSIRVWITVYSEYVVYIYAFGILTYMSCKVKSFVFLRNKSSIDFKPSL